MGLFDFSLKDIGETIKDIREAITGEVIKDPTKLAEIQYKLTQLENELKKGQIEINKIEAQNPNWFVAGWRPAVGWVCASALGYTYVLAPFLHSSFEVFKINFPLPTLDIGMLFNLMLALLGLAGMRTYEKTQKVQNLH